jgi:SAM-dependent methyltransferase
MQADILDLDKLYKKFDIIESSGVLHHMKEPLAGWKILVQCLRPGGLMKIALYSKLARQDIARIREEIAKLKIQYNFKELRNFRNKLISSDLEHHASMRSIPDFYSLSGFRDLLFHVQEHSFTIRKIQEYLRKLELQFCGFEIEDQVVRSFKSNYADPNASYDLEKWDEFESRNPDIFCGMYQFWCQKIH